MASGVSDIFSSTSGLSSSLTTDTSTTKKNEEIGRDQFLQLLITQLKNQDPESPADSKEFAVQLAQFTQVEKLISIDDKMNNLESSSLSSMAGYLGQQVILDGSTVNVEGGNGGQLNLNLSKNAASAMVELLNKDGEVVGQMGLGSLAAGKQTVSLSGLSVPDGSYDVQVSAISTTGSTFAPDVSVSGTVTGFIPGADPKLIVGGREVSVSEVQQVALSPATTAS